MSSVDGQGKGRLDGKLQAFHDKGESVVVRFHGDPGEDQGSVWVIGLGPHFGQNESVVAESLDQVSSPVAVTALDIDVPQEDHGCANLEIQLVVGHPG